MTTASVEKLPTHLEIEQAKETSRVLAKFSNHQLRIKVYDNENSGEDMILPGFALNLLLEILTQMSKGNAVSVLSVNAELTTQEAANLLNVSRPYLVEMLKNNIIAYRKVGAHRRILAKDVFDYKATEGNGRLKALDELTSQAQELKMGYE